MMWALPLRCQGLTYGGLVLRVLKSAPCGAQMVPGHRAAMQSLLIGLHDAQGNNGMLQQQQCPLHAHHPRAGRFQVTRLSGDPLLLACMAPRVAAMRCSI